MSEQLESYRDEIDAIDTTIVTALAQRMAVVKKVGEYKRQIGMAPLQPERWRAVLQDRITKGQELGLSEEVMTTIYEAIHREALRLEE